MQDTGRLGIEKEKDGMKWCEERLKKAIKEGRGKKKGGYERKERVMSQQERVKYKRSERKCEHERQALKRRDQ